MPRSSLRISAEKRLELLVNNAGFGTLGNFSGGGIAPQMDMHKVHVLATLRLTHAAVSALMPRDRGGVINVSSVSAFLPGHASYSSTKTWMNTFTECLHLELKSLGSHVYVQALCPGYTYTEFHDLLGLERDRIMSNRRYWLTPEFVVAESLRAFDEGRWLVVPSWRYRLIVFFLRILPRLVLHPICLRVAGRRESARRK
jgi:short-subunit dehydrogenase